MENRVRRNVVVEQNSSRRTLQSSSWFHSRESRADMEGQSSLSPSSSFSSSSSSPIEFRNNQNLSTSSPPIACVSFSALLAQGPSSSGLMSSGAISPPTSCSRSNCSCLSSSSPLPLNSLIVSPFSACSLSSFFPDHIAQQCTSVACSSSCCSSAPSVAIFPLNQSRHKRRNESTTVKRTGPQSSLSSFPSEVRLSSLASLASAVQAFSHSSGKSFVAGGDRDRKEDEHLKPNYGAGARRKQSILAAAHSSLRRGITSLFQQLPRELDGFRWHKSGLAAAATKQRRGADSLRAQAPRGNETIDTTGKNEALTTTGEKKTNKKKAIQTSQHLLAGAVAAMVSRTIVAPLERLKLEYLVRGAQGSVLNTVQTILQKEGLGGFWKGNGVNLLRTAPFKSVNFFCYDSYRNYLLKFGNRKEVTNLERLAAGAAAGVTATILCFPLDTIRTLMVAPGGEALGGMVGCFNHMVRTEGILSLYKGLLPAVVSMAPSGAVFYGVYDMLKISYLNSPEGRQMLKARRKRMKEAKERGEEDWVQPELGPVRTLLFGAIAGACSESVTYPFEVVRRAQQLQHAAVKLGMAGTFQMLWQKGGVKALYAGLFPSTLQVLPSAAFSYFVYETMKIAFKIP